MLRKSLAVGIVAVLAAVLAATALARRDSTPTLVGTVGPGFTIHLTKAGTAVKTLKAGAYKLVIHDRASIHAWSLDGPHGFAKDYTKVPFVGTKTFAVNFKAGKYKFYCPPHESIMFGHFTVK
jgi:plastocyanin